MNKHQKPEISLNKVSKCHSYVSLNLRLNYKDEQVNAVYRNNNGYILRMDSLCGLVVTVPDYKSRGPGSMPGATRFSEK
jgi:hypothetical protein